MNIRNNSSDNGSRPPFNGRGGRQNNNRKKYRVNREIRAREVLVIDPEGNQLGVMNIVDAVKRAVTLELDLVEISPYSTPPVCKIVDYGKMIYLEQKKQSEAKKNQKTIDIKEVQFSPTIGQNDFEVKLNRMKRFLEEGNKVKIVLRFRGREITHKEVGLKVIERIKENLGDSIKIEKEPKLEGKQITMNIAPK